MRHKVFLSHAGKQHSYYTAKSLNDLELLEEYHTSSYFKNELLQKLIEFSGNTLLTKRFLKGLHGKRIKAHWKFEFEEQLILKFLKNSDRVQNAVYKRDINFDEYISRLLKNSESSIFWGFQGSSYQSIISANKLGKKTICELSTGHVQESIRILNEESKINPDWSDSFDNLYFPDFYLERLENEPRRADLVIAASTFTKNTLINSGISESKIRVLPLGFDSRFIPFVERQSESDEKLKLLYTGRVTQRKGISYLLEAAKKCHTFSNLDIIGFVHGKGIGLKKHQDFFRLIPSKPQLELFKIYGNYDALVLPSLFEGFGLVILEAMAAGLPVITTKNTIGADIIENEKNGFLVELRDSQSIVDAILKIKSLKESGEINEMRVLARKTAEKYSWDNYTQRLEKVINSI